MKAKVLIALIAAMYLGLTAAAPAQAAVKPMREKGRASEAFGQKCLEGACFSFKASAKGRPIADGRFVGSFEVDMSQDFTNARGLTCSPAVGRGAFKRNASNKIEVVFEGFACDLGKVDLTRIEAYGRVVGGTGDFQGARGRGGLQMFFEFEEDPRPLTYQWDGTIKP